MKLYLLVVLGARQPGAEPAPGDVQDQGLREALLQRQAGLPVVLEAALRRLRGPLRTHLPAQDRPVAGIAEATGENVGLQINHRGHLQNSCILNVSWF